MRFTPYSYVISLTDIADIQRLGYVFEGPVGHPTDFVNKHFPNLDLLKALSEIDGILSGTTTAALFRKIILKDGVNPRLEIQFFSADYRDENRGLALARIFVFEPAGHVVIHELLRLPSTFRKMGISKGSGRLDKPGRI